MKSKNEKYVVGTRGRIFKGTVVKVFPMRVVIVIERLVFAPKYERFYKRQMRLHSRLPDNMNIEVGDIVKVRECRPLSKIVHSIVIEKVSGGKGK